MEYNEIKINFNKNYIPLNIKNLNSLKIINLDRQDTKSNLECLDSLTNTFEGKYYFEADRTPKYFDSTVLSVKKLECTWREVVKVQLDSNSSFIPGDSIGLLCPNSEYYVNEIFKILDISDEVYYIERTGTSKFKFKGKLSDFFKYCFDFNSIPKKSFLMDISKKSPRSDELRYLCSKSGSMDYMNISKNWNNIIDILYSFDCKIKLEDILMNCEILKPRYFSLTNKVNSNFEIIIATVFKDLVFKSTSSVESIRTKRLYGHVSSYFRNYKEPGNIKVCLRESPLIRLNDSKKILMICTGTGIAPFISFIKNYTEYQQLWLIYGFRNEEDDISKEFNIPNHIKVTKCMSCKGEYVTNFIKNNNLKIEEFIKIDSSIYFCGRQEIQLEIYRIFLKIFPKIIEEKKIFFDNWN